MPICTTGIAGFEPRIAAALNGPSQMDSRRIAIDHWRLFLARARCRECESRMSKWRGKRRKKYLFKTGLVRVNWFTDAKEIAAARIPGRHVGAAPQYSLACRIGGHGEFEL
ncbi:MAG TPA: hypothetical protein VGL34_07790 [Steroidobacteraceae bacterium]|jgi:hypothetical protein